MGVKFLKVVLGEMLILKVVLGEMWVCIMEYVAKRVYFWAHTLIICLIWWRYGCKNLYLAQI